MLTKINIKNFKLFGDVDVELGNPVVFIGPNNSGKTTALQALALWGIGVKIWHEKRGSRTPKERSGVTINRRDLISVPVPNANLLWHNLRVRDVQRTPKLRTNNVRIDIIVEGISQGKKWECGLEFDYANPESFYCRPLRISKNGQKRMQIPEEATKINIAYLPPMSGLATQEIRLDPGAINVRVGEGRTAEVLRNLSYNVGNPDLDEDKYRDWKKIVYSIQKLFGVTLNSPKYISERGEIVMTYTEERSPATLDITSAGRGLHQTLLILAYLYSNPRSVLLLDEPDAHLEILRQRQIYKLLVETAQAQECQIIAASHSEVLLNEAAGSSTLVAFVGTPHRIDNRSSQVAKALKTIGFEHYYLAETKGWVLYLEGSTDLSILRTFAEKLDHPVREYLETPFVYYVDNQPPRVYEHYYGLVEAKPDLLGVAIFDRIESQLQPSDSLKMTMWTRRELENYLCYPETLINYARGEGTYNLFSVQNEITMRECIEYVIPPFAYNDRKNRWWNDVKASDDYLDHVFEEYFTRLNLPNIIRKSNYHELARVTPVELISPEIGEKLDLILETAKKARPAT